MYEIIIYIQNLELKTITMEIVYHSINKYYEEIKTPFPGIKTYLQKAWNGKLDVCETYSTQSSAILLINISTKHHPQAKTHAFSIDTSHQSHNLWISYFGNKILD